MLPTPELDIAKRLPAFGCSLEQAQRYTRWLAARHYENFTVVSWLLPRHLRHHFANVYAYCRWSDDLGDETGDAARSLALMDAWEEELRQIYDPRSGGPAHPVLIALAETVRAKDIPIEPFTGLLRAFRQDQTVHRYQTWDDLLGYCRYSANPVGRLVLYLCGYRDAQRQQLSDFTCTALQLANFWQDVAGDLEKGRIYIPIEALAAHGLSEQDVLARSFDSRYAGVMRSLIGRTRELFAAGAPLAALLDDSLRVDIELFSRGGLSILESIEAIGCDTLHTRPSLTRAKELRLLGSALARLALARLHTQRRPPAPARARQAAPAPATDPAANAAEDGALIADSYAECQRVARAAHSNFFLAFFGLPRPKRNALCALYAFMRLVDNVSDDPSSAGADAEPLAARQRALVRWRTLLDQAAGDSRPRELAALHAILPALADTIRRFQIPPRYFHDLVLGAEMDLTIRSYATFGQLSEYCYRVAGTVGLTCLRVFGFRDPRAPDLAERLGLAFQLTNIIRDVRTDLEMDRVYIPQEDLDQFACARSELAGPLNPRLKQLLAFQAARAWRFYEEGAPLIAEIEPDSQATLWALVRTYSTLLARIEERGFDVFSQRISLSAAERIQHLMLAGVNSRLSGKRVWWNQDALPKRIGDRRRSGGTVLRRRAG